MASPASKKRARKPSALRSNPPAREERLKELMKEAVREVLREQFSTHGASVWPTGAEFDWLEAARQLRHQMPQTQDSTPLLKSLREERAKR